MKEYTIKHLTSEYEAFMWELLYKNIFEAREEKPAERGMEDLYELERYIKQWGSHPEDLGFVALDSRNQPVGAVWIRKLLTHEKGWGFIDEETPEMNIAIKHDHRNQGIGTALITELFDTLGDHYSQVSLSVNPNNPSVRLYERFGFEKVASAPPAITMLKKIK